MTKNELLDLLANESIHGDTPIRLLDEDGQEYDCTILLHIRNCANNEKYLIMK